MERSRVLINKVSPFFGKKCLNIVRMLFIYFLILQTLLVMETSGSVKLLTHVEDEGFQIDFNPPGDGMCFYASAGYQLGLSATTVKNLLFDYLRTHRFDVCITNSFH